jgi:predicted DNA-binding WGR domain protein
MTSTTYLELSEGGSGAHKFYEIALDDTRVTIRFGRIGTAGRADMHSFSTPAEAERFYQDKIKEKTKKGYAPAIPGQTEKKAITKKEMTEDDFWNLIEETKAKSQGDIYEQVEHLRTRLRQLSNTEIFSFHAILHRLLSESFQARLWGAAYIINGGCGDDGFDYFRGWLIAQGREVFYAALQDPDSLADVAEADAECEEIWYVAQEAYEEKTGKDDFQQHVAAPAGELQGDLADWSDDEGNEDETKLQAWFPHLYTKLWNK